MPKIRKIKVGDRKDKRGGGYSRRKDGGEPTGARISLILGFNMSNSK